VDKSERRGSVADTEQNVIAHYERAFNDHQLPAGAGVRERQRDVLSE
jgi:hypothetical protein